MFPISRCSIRLSFPLILLLALFMASTAQAEYLGNISFDQPSPSFLPHGVHVIVSIDYKIDDPAGRRIYVSPYTNGSPTQGYAVHGSVLYPQGTGTTTKFFTITSGNPVIVDEVRVHPVTLISPKHPWRFSCRCSFATDLTACTTSRPIGPNTAACPTAWT